MTAKPLDDYLREFCTECLTGVCGSCDGSPCQCTHAPDACPRGVPDCDGVSCQWTCRGCGCQNCHEVFCWNCGAGCPDCACPCDCPALGQRDDDGTPGWCDSCRMNIHAEAAKAATEKEN